MVGHEFLWFYYHLCFFLILFYHKISFDVGSRHSPNLGYLLMSGSNIWTIKCEVSKMEFKMPYQRTYSLLKLNAKEMWRSDHHIHKVMLFTFNRLWKWNRESKRLYVSFCLSLSLCVFIYFYAFFGYNPFSHLTVCQRITFIYFIYVNVSTERIN